MRHEATLSFDFPSATAARRVANSITPELGEIDDDRSSVDATVDDDTLTLHVSAEDLIALRAGCNTWCAHVRVAEETGNC